MAWPDSSGIIGTATNMKCAKLNKSIMHRSSRRHQGPRLGFKLRGPFEKFATFSTGKLHTSEDPRCTNYTFGEANGESSEWFYCGRLENHLQTASRNKLVIGNWNITSLNGLSTNCWRKPTDIPWMFRTSCTHLWVLPAFLKIVIGRCSAVLSYLNALRLWIAPFCQCLEAGKVIVQNDARLSALSNTSVD